MTENLIKKGAPTYAMTNNEQLTVVYHTPALGELRWIPEALIFNHPIGDLIQVIWTGEEWVRANERQQ